MMTQRLLLTLGLISSAAATVFFKENFDDKWESRWVVPSKWKKAEELGAWNHTAGDWYGDAKDKGIKVRACSFESTDQASEPGLLGWAVQIESAPSQIDRFHSIH